VVIKASIGPGWPVTDQDHPDRCGSEQPCQRQSSTAMLTVSLRPYRATDTVRHTVGSGAWAGGTDPFALQPGPSPLTGRGRPERESDRSRSTTRRRRLAHPRGLADFATNLVLLSTAAKHGLDHLTSWGRNCHHRTHGYRPDPAPRLTRFPGHQNHTRHQPPEHRLARQHAAPTSPGTNRESHSPSPVNSYGIVCFNLLRTEGGLACMAASPHIGVDA